MPSPKSAQTVRLLLCSPSHAWDTYRAKPAGDHYHPAKPRMPSDHDAVSSRPLSPKNMRRLQESQGKATAPAGPGNTSSQPCAPRCQPGQQTQAAPAAKPTRAILGREPSFNSATMAPPKLPKKPVQRECCRAKSLAKGLALGIPEGTRFGVRCSSIAWDPTRQRATAFEEFFQRKRERYSRSAPNKSLDHGTRHGNEGRTNKKSPERMAKPVRRSSGTVAFSWACGVFGASVAARRAEDDAA